MNIFTSQEKTIIKFLAGSLLLGTIVTAYRHWYSPELSMANMNLESFKAASEKPWGDSLNKGMENKEIQSLIIININTSNKDELMTVPGIGPVMAGRIIRYREDFGPYKTLEDIQRVKGIGVKTLERIKPYIKIEDSEAWQKN